jgi:hypothetical protein
MSTIEDKRYFMDLELDPPDGLTISIMDKSHLADDKQPKKVQI